MPKVKNDRPRGWLLFFILTLSVFGPLYNIFLLWVDIANDNYYLTNFWGLYYISITLSSVVTFVAAGIFLWKKKPYAVKFAKIILITSVASTLIASFMTGDYSNVIKTLIYSTIWTTFLFKSKQVKNLYGKLKENRNGYQVWPKLAILSMFTMPEFAFVFSLISLKNIFQNKKLKGFWLSVATLIISAAIFTYLAWFLITTNASYVEVPDDIDSYCSDFCYYTPAEYYKVNYDFNESSFLCQCLDEDQNLVEQKYYLGNISKYY